MELKPEHKEYILKHAEEIRGGNWEEFFKNGKYPEGIGEPLYLSNIPFMQELGYIPYKAFYNCTNLLSITIPNGVISIGQSAFSRCTELTNVTIGNGVISIGHWAFSECCNITSITIPASVTSIGELAFYYCQGLTSIEIPLSVTSIGNDAFYGITKDLDIKYSGTKEQWKHIYNKNAFKNTYFTVNCTDGQIVKKRK